MIKITLLLIVVNFSFLSVNAQETERDSATVISNAKKSAKNFTFDKANKKVVIRNLNNPTSDYFKPSESNSKVSLLKDSLYVKTFKVYAIKHIKAKRTTKT